MSKYDWTNVPSDVKWIATGEDGKAYGFDYKPYVNKKWISVYQGFQRALAIQPFVGEIIDSLEERPR